jgi:hypothetical protein
VENEKKVLVIERRKNEEEFAQRHREDEVEKEKKVLVIERRKK